MSSNPEFSFSYMFEGREDEDDMATYSDTLLTLEIFVFIVQVIDLISTSFNRRILRKRLAPFEGAFSWKAISKFPKLPGVGLTGPKDDVLPGPPERKYKAAASKSVYGAKSKASAMYKSKSRASAYHVSKSKANMVKSKSKAAAV